MTALVTADWHLSDNPRDEYRFQFISGEFRNIVRRERPKQLIILGDLTDAKDYHSSVLVNRVASELAWLRGECPIYILKGNHDYLDPAMPYFKFLQYMEGITWINDPKCWAIEGLGNCTFLPHTRDYERDWAALNFAPYKRDPNTGFIFCHNTFEGADAGHGSPLTGIPTKALPKTCVISGDVHVPQQLDQVCYVGAPYTIVFGDEYRPRLLRIGWNRTTKIESIHYHVTKKIVIDIAKPNAKLLPDYEGIQNSLLKVRVQLEASDYANWNQIRDRIHKHLESYEGVEVCMIQPIKAGVGLKLNRKCSNASLQTDAELLDRYGKRRSVSAETLKTGHWLMQKAK